MEKIMVGCYVCKNCNMAFSEKSVKKATAEYLFGGTEEDIENLDELGETVCPECGHYHSTNK